MLDPLRMSLVDARRASRGSLAGANVIPLVGRGLKDDGERGEVGVAGAGVGVGLGLGLGLGGGLGGRPRPRLPPRLRVRPPPRQRLPLRRRPPLPPPQAPLQRYSAFLPPSSASPLHGRGSEGRLCVASVVAGRREAAATAVVVGESGSPLLSAVQANLREHGVRSITHIRKLCSLALLSMRANVQC